LTQTPEQIVDWQPVRLCDPGNGSHTNRSRPNKFKVKKKDAVARIVRVRPDPYPDDHGDYICNPEMIYEIHPEDARNILNYIGSGRARVCEHQILAD
jgi:hypothetical protein